MTGVFVSFDIHGNYAAISEISRKLVSNILPTRCYRIVIIHIGLLKLETIRCLHNA